MSKGNVCSLLFDNTTVQPPGPHNLPLTLLTLFLLSYFPQSHPLSQIERLFRSNYEAGIFTPRTWWCCDFFGILYMLTSRPGRLFIQSSQNPNAPGGGFAASSRCISLVVFGRGCDRSHYCHRCRPRPETRHPRPRSRRGHVHGRRPGHSSRLRYR